MGEGERHPASARLTPIILCSSSTSNVSRSWPPSEWPQISELSKELEPYASLWHISYEFSMKKASGVRTAILLRPLIVLVTPIRLS